MSTKQALRPSDQDAATALRVLLWLSENRLAAADRDEVGYARHLVDQEWPDA